MSAAAVSVRLHAPVFTAGGRVGFTVTLSSRPPAAAHADPARAGATSSSGISSSAAGGPGAPGAPGAPTRRVAYVVAQVAGRWVSDRAWLRPAAHAPGGVAPPGALDLHAPTGAPWDAALDDAFHASGGSVSGSAAAAAAAAHGHTGVIFRSAALRICEDEPLPPPGAHVAFDGACVLPDPIPATLRGTAMRYGYSLIVVVAAADSHAPPHVVRVPFRVVPRDEDPDLVDLVPPPPEPTPPGDNLGLPASGPTEGPNGPAQTPRVSAKRSARRRATIVPVPTPRNAGPAPSRFLEADPASALSMTASRAKIPPPTDIDFALAVSLNGRLTPYRPDDELWKPGGTGLDDDSALSLIRYIPPTQEASTTSSAASETTLDSTSPMPSLGARSSADSAPPASQGSPHIPKFAAVVPGRPTDNSVESADTRDSEMRRPQRRANALPVYQISRASNPLARIYLPKRVHHLGEAITAVFDFQGTSSARVYRLNARLECQEIVQPDYALGTKNGSVGANGLVFRKVYGEHGEFVMLNHNTHVTFSVPHEAPVTFATSVVEIQWLLHFVFIVPKASALPDKVPQPRNGLDSRGSVANNRMYDSQDEESKAKDSSQGDDISEDDPDLNTPLRPNRRTAGESVSIVHSPDDEVLVIDSDALMLPSNGKGHQRDSGGAVDADDTPEWLGGDWRGNNPKSWAHLLPARETEALHWTLPIVVTSRPGSRWGLCPFAQLQLSR